MKQTKTENWIFTSYDKKDKVIESFEIKDRTQSEATNEAIHYVEAHQEIADWTLQITPASKEPNTVGGDGFTKGEWVVADFGDEIAIKEADLMGKDGKWMFADRICTMGNYTTKNMANASLIAAAPDMLNALKEVTEDLKNMACNFAGYSFNESYKNYFGKIASYAEAKAIINRIEGNK